VLEPWFAPDELDAGFDFGFQGNVLGFVQGRGRTVAFNRYLEKRQKVRAGHLVAHYLSSHDTPGALFQLKGDLALFRLAAALLFTTSGIPVIYYGDEVARLGGEWPDNRSDMPWGRRGVLPGEGLPRDETLRRDYQKLIGIRKTHPALSRGQHAGLSAEGDLYVFARRDPPSGDAVVVAINRGSAPATATFGVPPEWGSASAVDLLDSSAAGLAPNGGSLTLTVAPRGYRILVAAPR
jgi:alpha-amylase